MNIDFIFLISVHFGKVTIKIDETEQFDIIFDKLVKFKLFKIFI